jgi:DNA-binding protein HU-beta
MTKAEIVTNISDKLGVEKSDTQEIVNHFMKEVRSALESGENVYLRGFGSFVVKNTQSQKRT